MITYDQIGRSYSATRRPDPRIAAHIRTALGDAESVINVGAGAGSYEPSQTVLAIEPSPVMIKQRAAGSAPVVQARAEALPVPDFAANAAMALLTIHHSRASRSATFDGGATWRCVIGGFREPPRECPRRVQLSSDGRRK